MICRPTGKIPDKELLFSSLEPVAEHLKHFVSNGLAI
jgi:hypothetical protein